MQAELTYVVGLASQSLVSQSLVEKILVVVSPEEALASPSDLLRILSEAGPDLKDPYTLAALELLGGQAWVECGTKYQGSPVDLEYVLRFWPCFAQQLGS